MRKKRIITPIPFYEIVSLFTRLGCSIEQLDDGLIAIELPTNSSESSLQRNNGYQVINIPVPGKGAVLALHVYPGEQRHAGGVVSRVQIGACECEEIR